MKFVWFFNVQHKTNVEEVVRIAALKTDRLHRENWSLDSRFEDFGMDSLDVVMFVSEIESQVQVELPSDKNLQFLTFRDIVKEFESLLKNN